MLVISTKKPSYSLSPLYSKVYRFICTVKNKYGYEFDAWLTEFAGRTSVTIISQEERLFKDGASGCSRSIYSVEKYKNEPALQAAVMMLKSQRCPCKC